MGAIHDHTPVLFVLAAFSRYGPALHWTRDRAAEHYGPIALTSDVFPFAATQYYESTMGTDLKKIFFAFESLIDPARLVELKHQANRWEDEYRETHPCPEARPLNLDPGYLTEAKLVLASTKDRDHRIYLDHGIYAEVTLHYQRGAGWQPRDWTYPDYRSEPYHQFFTRCRQYLRKHKHAA